METPQALVLSWSSAGLTIRCPNSDCARKEHRHGCTLPSKDRSNERLAHCIVDGQPKDSSYALVFPFECMELTEGLGWELDRVNRVWRTVSLNIPDVGSKPRTEAVIWQPVKVNHRFSSELLDVPDSDDEGSISEKLQKLQLKNSKQVWKEKQWFDSFCVNDEIEAAKAVLDHSSDARALIEMVEWEDQKPILVMASEEGHLDIVDMIVNYKPSLEATDPATGRTALMSAVYYQHAPVALRLLEAGASIDCRSDDGDDLIHIIRASITKVKDTRIIYEQDMNLDRQASSNQDKVHSLDRQLEELEMLLRRCLDCEDVKQTKMVFEHVRALHGSSQAQGLLERESWDLELLSSALRTRLQNTPASSDFKTIGCLERGKCFSRITAVSGWDSGAFGGIDGALDRPVWVTKVGELAEIVGHNLEPHEYDKKESPGTYHACHVEKQLLAYMIWNHTTSLGVGSAEIRQAPVEVQGPASEVEEDDLEKSDWALDLRASEPSKLYGLSADIHIYQPSRWSSYVCDDCAIFCSKVQERYGLQVKVYGQAGMASELLWDSESR